MSMHPRTRRAVSFVPALAWLLLPAFLMTALVVGVSVGQPDGGSTPDQPSQPADEGADDGSDSAADSTDNEDGTGNDDGDAAPEPQPARLRYAFDAAEERRDHVWDFTGHSESSVILEGRNPERFSTVCDAFATLRMRCEDAGTGATGARIGFALTRLGLAWRDPDHTLEFAIGPGLGPDGQDGMTARVDGADTGSVPGLDLWTTSDTGATLPESLDETVATARIHADGRWSRRADVLPGPGSEGGATAPKSLIYYANPAELARMILLPVPDSAPVLDAASPQRATWTAEVQFPALPGLPTTSIPMRFAIESVTADSATITATPAEEMAGTTLHGRIEWDPYAAHPRTVTWTLTRRYTVRTATVATTLTHTFRRR